MALEATFGTHERSLPSLSASTTVLARREGANVTAELLSKGGTLHDIATTHIELSQPR